MGGFLKWWYPKSSILIGFVHHKACILSTPIDGNPRQWSGPKLGTPHNLNDFKVLQISTSHPYVDTCKYILVEPTIKKNKLVVGRRRIDGRMFSGMFWSCFSGVGWGVVDGIFHVYVHILDAMLQGHLHTSRYTSTCVWEQFGLLSSCGTCWSCSERRNTVRQSRFHPHLEPNDEESWIISPSLDHESLCKFSFSCVSKLMRIPTYTKKHEAVCNYDAQRKPSRWGETNRCKHGEILSISWDMVPL